MTFSFHDKIAFDKIIELTTGYFKLYPLLQSWINSVKWARSLCRVGVILTHGKEVVLVHKLLHIVFQKN